MGHSNQTNTLELPQFVADDKPTWMGDVNGAFQKIDAGVAEVIANTGLAVTQSNLAVTQALKALQLAETANETVTSISSDATQALLIANNALTVANNTATLANQIVTDVDELKDFTVLQNKINDYSSYRYTLYDKINLTTASGNVANSVTVDASDHPRMISLNTYEYAPDNTGQTITVAYYTNLYAIISDYPSYALIRNTGKNTTFTSGSEQTIRTHFFYVPEEHTVKIGAGLGIYSSTQKITFRIEIYTVDLN